MLIVNKLVSYISLIMLSLGFLMLAGRAAAGGNAELSSAYAEGRLLVTGSSTMCPMMAEVGRRFQSLHRGVTVEVQCGGSERGISDLNEGKCDIGMTSRPLNKRESNLLGFPVARDGVSIIVHKNNPVKSLSNAQVVGIFTGKIINWKKIGGLDAPIDVILREKQKSSSELLGDYYKLKWKDIKGRVIAGDNPVTINAVASDPQAIGYVSSGNAEYETAAGIPIKILPVNGMMPTRRNIITGNYPISRPLMLVTSKLPTGLAREFIDFSLSSSIVDLIEKYEYVPYQD